MTRVDPSQRTQPQRGSARPGAAEALAVAAQGGDRGAFESLVKRFEGPLVGYLFARTGCREDALDLAQEAFLRAWTALARYDSRWRFSTWLYTIASRLATSQHRRAKPQDRTAGDMGLGSLPSADDPIQHMAQREERLGLWAKAAEVLSSEQRAALWLRYVEDLSAEEIGQALGRRAVTVRVILFRARERLGAHLDAEQLLEPSHPASPAAGAILARRVSGGNL